MDERLFGGRVSLKVGDTVRGQWALPSWEPVSAGRLPYAGLHVPESWVPSRLCRFIPYDRGWVVQLGRPRATVASRYIGQHTFGSRAMVALQPGRALMTFPELDDHLYLQVVIGAGEGEGLQVLQDQPEVRGEEPRTAYAVGLVDIPEAHRRILAVAYLHLLTRQAKPKNVALTAGQRLGKSEQAVKNVLTKTRDHVNRERWLDLRDTDHLGHYLVRLTRTITLADLPPEVLEGLPG
ncbi:hypothetical protein [Nocardioides solisilvae]|uniref:hypothetical protein n=1 Tax=Nocardioides solisilvae TaxID=1542435 RepID=UPI0013A55FD7|nr:hypothetical protein [Nocardioides solisilvae]